MDDKKDLLEVYQKPNIDKSLIRQIDRSSLNLPI